MALSDVVRASLPNSIKGDYLYFMRKEDRGDDGKLRGIVSLNIKLTDLDTFHDDIFTDNAKYPGQAAKIAELKKRGNLTGEWPDLTGVV